MTYFAPYIDGTGVHMPACEDRLQGLYSAYRTQWIKGEELTLFRLQ